MRRLEEGAINGEDDRPYSTDNCQPLKIKALTAFTTTIMQLDEAIAFAFASWCLVLPRNAVQSLGHVIRTWAYLSWCVLCGTP